MYDSINAPRTCPARGCGVAGPGGEEDPGEAEGAPGEPPGVGGGVGGCTSYARARLGVEPRRALWVSFGDRVPRLRGRYF